jgi:hypothetical protein
MDQHEYELDRRLKTIIQNAFGRRVDEGDRLVSGFLLRLEEEQAWESFVNAMGHAAQHLDKSLQWADWSAVSLPAHRGPAEAE